jgi:exopolysaccharide biosynthesis polyprenyl glycosylphosphotransferase
VPARTASDDSITQELRVAVRWTAQTRRQARATGERPRSGGALRRYRAIARWLAVSDAACILAALLGAYAVRYPDRHLPGGELAAIALAPLVWVGVFSAFDLYAPRRLPAAEEFRRVIGAAGVGLVTLVMVSYWSRSSFSRAWVGLTWVFVLVLELAVRRFWRRHQYRLRLNGRLALRTLIVGHSAQAARLAEILAAPGSGFKPLGFVHGPGAPTSAPGTLPVLGPITELEHLTGEHAADCLFVAWPELSAEELAGVVRAARLEGAEVRVLPNLPETLASRLTLLPVGPAIALALRPASLSGTQAVVKRAIDVVVASAALIASLPIALAVAIAIRLDSPGPVLFHQQRVTMGGREFSMHKFRTMRAEPGPDLDTTKAFFKLESDPRVTKLGAFLRRYSLDELPQFWNVLAGDMSVVGPRPLPADQVAANLGLLAPRHAVPSGITGWWQINGRSLVTPEEALRLDLFYIENWSPALDLYVLLKTLGAVVRRRGAF